jgi:hypothetical protein
VPLGFDVCHFLLQAENETAGVDPATSLGSIRARVGAPLAALGVPRTDHDLVWRCYLVELARRTFALRAGGRPTDRVTHGRAAIDRLLAEVERPTMEEARS